MKNKGFTLIELLAVIVILAVIALIATPLIMGTITKAKRNSMKDTAYGILKAGEQYVGEKLLLAENDYNGETITLPNQNKIQYKGGNGLTGELQISKEGNLAIQIHNNQFCAMKNFGEDEVTVTNYDEETCKLDGSSGGGETLNCDGKVPNSFSTDSWETVACAVKTGNLSKYNVGDEKEVTLTGEYAGTYTVRIANVSTPTECSRDDFSQSACGFVIEFKDIITNAQMNSTQTSRGGWPGSELYKKLNPSENGNTSQSIIYNALPEELKNVIMETKVVSGHGKNDTTNFTSVDKLYLLSTKEIWGKYNNYIFESSENETRQLDYYSNAGITVHNYSGAIKQYNGANSNWRLRSPYSSMHSDFYFVYLNGAYYSHVAESYYGIAPAFRVG